MAENRYLRHRFNGRIYTWNKPMSENLDLEEVTEEQAFPEKFVPAKQKGRKTKLQLETEEVPTPEEPVNEELNADASRNLPA